jgi:hypothetical protein
MPYELWACGALKITVGETITARFIVINTGRREGADVLSIQRRPRDC